MRRAFLVVVLTLVSCTPDVDAPVQSPAPPTTPEAIASPAPPEASPSPAGDFDVDAAMEHVRVLSVDIGLRMAGTEADERAAVYVRDVLASLGLESEMRPFPLPQGGTSWNVVGVPPGLDAAVDRYLIVGGHYDSLNGPGANDNASGIGVVLEAARVLRDAPAALPVKVIAFGAEERQPVPGPRRNHIGSRAYVGAMSDAQRENLVAFVNVDMVGRGEGLLCPRLDRGSREVADRLLRLAGELGIPCAERVTPNWSDHGTFLLAGMNAGWLWSGEDEALHSPRDTFDRVQPRPVQWAGRLTLAALRSYE